MKVYDKVNLKQRPSLTPSNAEMWDKAVRGNPYTVEAICGNGEWVILDRIGIIYIGLLEEVAK